MEEEDSDAASYYVDDANEDCEVYDPDLHISTTPQTITPSLHPWDQAGSGAFQQKIPNSNEVLNVRNILLPQHNSSWSFESEQTVLIAGGTRIAPKPQRKYVSLFLVFECASSKLCFQHCIYLFSSLVRPTELLANYGSALVSSHLNETHSNIVLRQAYLLLCYP